MSMQCLRETIDALEFETRLTALRHTGRKFDAIDLAEISMLRNRVDEIDEINRVMRSRSSDENIASCVASSVENAILAVERYAQERGEMYDLTTTNDESVDAWGWSDETPEGEMSWRCTIRIIEESDL